MPRAADPDRLDNANLFFRDLYLWCGQKMAVYTAAVLTLGLAAFLAFVGFMIVVLKVGELLNMGTEGLMLAFAVGCIALFAITLLIAVPLGSWLRKRDEKHHGTVTGARN